MSEPSAGLLLRSRPVAGRLLHACLTHWLREKTNAFSRNGFPRKRMDHQITAANISQLHRAAAQYNMSDPRHTCKRLPAMRPFSGTLIPLLKGPCMARTVNAVRLGTSRMSSPAQHTGTLTMSCPASLCPPLQPTAKRRDRPPELCVLPPPRPAAMLPQCWAHARLAHAPPRATLLWGGRGCCREVPFRTGGSSSRQSIRAMLPSGLWQTRT